MCMCVCVCEGGGGGGGVLTLISPAVSRKSRVLAYLQSYFSRGSDPLPLNPPLKVLSSDAHVCKLFIVSIFCRFR